MATEQNAERLYDIISRSIVTTQTTAAFLPPAFPMLSLVTRHHSHQRPTTLVALDSAEDSLKYC